MAITWRTKISVLDSKRGNVSVTLERIDNADLENIKVLNSYSVLDALIDTPERKQQVFDELERQYYAQKQKEIKEVAIIGTLAEDVKAVAETWETK